MLQKIKKMMKGICSSERIKMLSFMLLVGTVTAFAQNAAGDYSAGTTALGTVTDEIAKYVPYVVKNCVTPLPALWPLWEQSACISK